MNFTELRKKSGFTQKQLSEKLDIDQTTISKWELGRAKPRFDKLIEIAQLCNVNTDIVINCFKKIT